MKTVQVTMQDIWAATRPNIQISKKAYNRKSKYKKNVHI